LTSSSSSCDVVVVVVTVDFSFWASPPLATHLIKRKIPKKDGDGRYFLFRDAFNPPPPPPIFSHEFATS
jgi:hypothetical protein